MTRRASEPSAADWSTLEASMLDQQPAEDEYPLLKSEFFRRALPSEAVAALLDTLVEERIAGESRELDFTPWGGAYNRVPQDAIAFVHRRELLSLKHAAVVDSDSRRPRRTLLDAG